MHAKLYFERIPAIIAAIILLQTLYFKFTAHPDSVYIFTELNAEPYGRIGSGVIELITAILLLIPKTRLAGAILGFLIIITAIFSHFLYLGIEVRDDNGKLFMLAITVFLCCLSIMLYNRQKMLASVGIGHAPRD